MADDFGTLQSTVEQIAEAALDWEMALLGLQPYEGGWQGFLPGQSDPILVTPGGGAIVLGELLPAYPNGAPYDFPALIGKWNVQEISYDFIHWYLLPGPEQFADYVATMSTVASSLSVNTEVTPDGDTSPGQLESGNGDLDAQLIYLNSKVGGWEGTAMDTLLGYTSRLPSVIRGQKAIACLMGAGLTAEQELFKRARADVIGIAKGVLEVMKSQGGGGAFDLTLVGAVLSGASLFFTAGTSAAVIGGAQAALGALEPFLPKEQAPTPAQLQFGADNPTDVLAKMREALQKVDDTIGQEETIIKDSLRTALSETFTHDDVYDLSTKPSFVNDSPQANSLPEVIDVDPPILGFMGAAVMPEIAEPLTAARTAVAGCSNQGVWYRSGDIGYDEYGSAAEWLALGERLVDVASGTATNINDIGQAMEDVAAIFIDVDATISKDYGELTEILGIDE